MKYRKQIIIAIVFLIVFPVYFFFFFQEGISVSGAFLLKKQVDNTTTYSDKGISILVNKTASNTAQITFSQNGSVKTYTIQSKETAEYLQEILILENDKEIFNGLYDDNKNSNLRVFEKDGTPFLGESNIVTIGNSTPPNSLSIVQLVNIFCNDFNIRGKVIPLLFAVILLALWVIDICYPRVLFWFQHFLSVENPEPSEFYLDVQCISWVALPIVAVTMMIKSLT